MVILQAIEGKYEVLEKIKEGGMGAVYKVRHRYLDEVRVIKVIRPNLDPTPDLCDRFLREAQVANRLRHPNIAMLHDFAVGDDGNAFIVMEYIDGLTLEDLVKLVGPPPIGLALEIGRQALRALGYLHRRGYVHRDVAPDNLMLTRGVDGEPLVKLIDLGIAKVLEGDGGFTSTGMFLGKPRYASPEHFGADNQVSEKSDLYSFGVVLYELLTGICPIQGRDPASYMAGHLLRPVLDFGETDPRGRLPSDLRWVLLRTLAKKAEERIDSADELARHLTAIQAQYPWDVLELEHALTAAHRAAAGEAAAVSPSTQDFLDRQFQAGATPAPTAMVTMDTSEVPLAPPLPLRIQLPEEPRTSSGTVISPSLSTLPTLPPVPPPPGLAVDLRMAGMPGPTSVLDDTVTLPGRAGLRAGWDAVRWDGAPLSPAGTENAAPPATAAAIAATAAAPEPPVYQAAEAKRRPPIVSMLTGLFVAAALFGGLWVYTHPAQKGLAGPATTDIAAPAVEAAADSAVADGSAPPATTATPATTGPGKTALPLATAAKTPAEAPGTTKTAESAPPPVPPVAETAVDGLIRPGPGVEYPEPLSIPGGAYPEAAKGSGKSPTVTLRVLVDEKGTVIDSRIRDGEAGFNEAAQEAARRARFLPGKKDGTAGKMWAEIGIEFTAPPPAAAPPATAGDTSRPEGRR